MVVSAKQRFGGFYWVDGCPSARTSFRGSSGLSRSMPGRSCARSQVQGRDEALLIDAERRHIFGQLERGELIDEARRHIERELDLWESQLLRNIPAR
jgi:hypothetical protein